jgi:hypothetical protein
MGEDRHLEFKLKGVESTLCSLRVLVGGGASVPAHKSDSLERSLMRFTEQVKMG